MKELSMVEKAKAYDSLIERLKDFQFEYRFSPFSDVISDKFPELIESKDERIRKVIYGWICTQPSQFFDGGFFKEEILAWLEKAGKYSIYNVPSREIILAIWDLGNEWKELTNGSISTEYGTQLEYIQKHWNESEYYLREKQSKQKSADKVELVEKKPAWSEEDERIYQSIIDDTVQENQLNDKQTNWLKDIKYRYFPKTDEDFKDFLKAMKL